MGILYIGICRMQQNKPRSNRQSICRERSVEKSPRQALFRDHDNQFRDGKFDKKEPRPRAKKKRCPREREAYLQHTGRSVHKASAIVCPCAERLL